MNFLKIDDSIMQHIFLYPFKTFSCTVDTSSLQQVNQYTGRLLCKILPKSLNPYSPSTWRQSGFQDTANE